LVGSTSQKGLDTQPGQALPLNQTEAQPVNQTEAQPVNQPENLEDSMNPVNDERYILAL
jgi:hypothetical protein